MHFIHTFRIVSEITHMNMRLKLRKNGAHITEIIYPSTND